VRGALCLGSVGAVWEPSSGFGWLGKSVVTVRTIYGKQGFEANSGWWFGTFGLFFIIFPYIWNNNPNWLIFFRGVETTNQN